MHPVSISRRRLLAVAGLAPWAGLSGCGTPLPLVPPVGAPDAEAQRLLQSSADVHGWDAYRRLNDINVRYAGQWRPTIDRIQPVVVDKRYRGASEERLLPRAGIVAQAYTGEAGRKQVSWQRGRTGDAKPGQVQVWYDGRAVDDAGVLDASALVAEAYGLFLLGPLWVAERGVPLRMAGTERVNGRHCRVVEGWLQPGLGRVALDRVALCIDSSDGITRRLRFSLEGYPGTQGAVAEVDTFDHERVQGVLWPMRSYEEVVHPLRVPAHDWHIEGLDLDRGYGPEALRGPVFGGAAAAPAREWRRSA